MRTHLAKKHILYLTCTLYKFEIKNKIDKDNYINIELPVPAKIRKGFFFDSGFVKTEIAATDNVCVNV